MCMYGRKCYQKSRKHREAYSHDENEVTGPEEKTKNDTVCNKDEKLSLIFLTLFLHNFADQGS